MTPITRHAESIKEKFFELGDELFSFISLVLLTSVEAFFLFVFGKLHELAHDYLDHSRWCPIKIAIIIMGLSFLLLNIEIVIAFFLTHTLKIFRRVRSAFAKTSQERGNKIMLSDVRDNTRPQSVSNGAIGIRNVTISTTMAGAYAIENLSHDWRCLIGTDEALRPSLTQPES